MFGTESRRKLAVWAPACAGATALLSALCACSPRSSGPFQPPVQSLEAFVLTETRAGATQWILKAREAILHDSGSADLASPHIDIYKDGKPASEVESRQGTYDDKSRDMHLKGDVVVVSRDEDSSDKTTLKTDSLDYVEAERKFKTDEPVVIERRGSVMHGRGLVASHDLSEIHVLHEEAKFK